MSDSFFEDLNIPKPDHHLEISSHSHAVQTAKIMTAFEPVILQEKPDWILVVSDVNSTIACTFVCLKLGVKNRARRSRTSFGRYGDARTKSIVF